MSDSNPRALLLPKLSQYQVDFVIPRVGVDLPLAIDPFLLFKSRDEEYRKLHMLLLQLFNAGIEAAKSGDFDEARRVFDFPEVSAIGFGYTRKGKRGSGVGTHLTGLIIDTLSASPALVQRGVRHIEEMQLLSAGIGPDRVSDMAANVFKRFLIEYTQRQCRIWDMPVERQVPIPHIYNHESKEWEDSFEDLPVSPINGEPILLVPRRIVRTLTWINYDDFVASELSAYLSARRNQVRRSTAPRTLAGEQPQRSKPEIVELTRRDISLVDRYVRSREQQGADARPTLDYIDQDACREAEALKERLSAMPAGRDSASEYQLLVLEIMNYLFNPELIDGKPEVRTIDGTERRDIIFTNDSDETFWSYIRSNHDGVIIMFEAKNTENLDIDAINQTATYLGDRIGRFGVIVTRRPPKESVVRKIISVFNDSGGNRKVILTVCDDELRTLLHLRCRNGSPTKWMQNHYREFRVSLQ